MLRDAPSIDLNAERKKREPVWPEPNPLPSRGDIGTRDPFPLDLLPPALQAAASETARFVKAPEAAPSLVGLSVVATAIGKRAIVEERAGLVHFPALFLVGVADSGERKSPIFRLMTEPLEDWCEQQTANWEIAARTARARNVAIDHATQVARKKAKGKEDLESAARTIADLESERVAVPPPPRLFTTDTTEQRVFQLMHDRGGAFAVMSGEGRPVLDAIMGKYSGDNRTGDAIYLAGISGDTITRDRVGTAESGGPESRTIRQPCLNVCVLVQPDKYLEAAAHPALRASGALARIWPVWLPSLVGRRLEKDGEPGLNQGRIEPFAALVHQLLKHHPPLDGNGRPLPHKVTLSAEAARERRRFHNAVESMMQENGDLADCRDIGAKCVSQTCKVALVLHLAESPLLISQPASEITGSTWAAAQSIGAWFLAEAVRVQRAADEDPTVAAARRVMDWLRKTPRETVNSSLLMQLAPRPRPKAHEASRVLALLEELGYLRSEMDESRRRPVYRVYPGLANLASLAGVDREK